MANTPKFRVTLRLSPEFYAQLEARGSHGQPLAAIVGLQALLKVNLRLAATDYLSSSYYGL